MAQAKMAKSCLKIAVIGRNKNEKTIFLSNVKFVIQQVQAMSMFLIIVKKKKVSTIYHQTHCGSKYVFFLFFFPVYLTGY